MREIAPRPPGGLPLPHRELSGRRPREPAAAATAAAGRRLRARSPTCTTTGRLLRAALADAGVDGRTAVWNDPAVDWARLRPRAWPTAPGTTSTTSTSSWPGSTASAAAGVPVRQRPGHAALEPRQALPARPRARRASRRCRRSWVEPAGDGRGAGRAGRLPEGEIVVKPAVSGGGYQTARYEAHEHDAARGPRGRAARPRDGRPWSSPTSPPVDAEGETGLVFLGGALQPRHPQGPDDPSRRRARRAA